jgi:chemotaxis protein MotB
MKDTPVIIIKKKVHGHGGHHGGAWKVAYADFVTAMMAFFLVMWIVGQSNPMKSGVAGYFRDPGAFQSGKGDESGLLPGAPAGVIKPGLSTPKEEAAAIAVLERAAERLRQSLEALPQFANIKDRVEIDVTSEGLRIELVDTSDRSFFEVGRSDLRADSIEILSIIADELNRLPNAVAVEGHTDSLPFPGQDGYGNWELSSDRANAARRAMEALGLRADRLAGVRGYADKKLRYPDVPLDPHNRRVSIIVHTGLEAS